MNVAFLFPSVIDDEKVIWRKALLQAQLLRELGHNVRIFSFSKAGASLSTAKHFAFPLVPGKSKETQLRQLVRKLIESQPDVAYLRRELWHPSYKRLMQSVPTVAEINTDEVREFSLTMPFLRRIYASLTHRLWEKHCAGFVAVTYELARNVKAKVPVTVIANGIAAANTNPASNGKTATKPHLFFSCTGGYSWHGIDKFVSLAKEFPEWQFTFAGDLPPEWSSYSAPANLTAHGRLSAAAADQLLADANIGVGTLGLHRKGMAEACPLKVRTYLSYGLPSIIGYHDTDFSQPLPYICQLPNEESNVLKHRDQIAEFVGRNFQSRVPWEQVRFASEEAKAARRAEFFGQVASGFKKA